MMSDIPLEDDFEDSQDLLARRRKDVKVNTTSTSSATMNANTIPSVSDMVILIKAETEHEGISSSTNLTKLREVFGDNTDYILSGVPVVFQKMEEPEEPEPDVDPIIILRELADGLRRQQDFLNHMVVEIQTIKKSVTPKKPWYQIF